jgi:hypothetical protein
MIPLTCCLFCAAAALQIAEKVPESTLSTMRSIVQSLAGGAWVVGGALRRGLQQFKWPCHQREECCVSTNL